MLVRAADIGLDQNESRSLGSISGGKRAHVVTTKSVAHEDIGALDTGVVKRSVQLIGNLDAAARHRSGIAESRTGAIVAARTCRLCDLRLHDGPDRRPVFPAGVKHDGRCAASHAVEVQTSTVRRDQISGPGVHVVARRGARPARENQKRRGCGGKRLHGVPSGGLHCSLDPRKRADIAVTCGAATGATAGRWLSA